MPKHVLNVGQCNPDHNSLSRFLQSRYDVQIARAATAVEALDLLRKQSFDLVLVNRKLDSDYSDGTEVIRLMKAEPALAATPVMLVTNYAEHQANAMALGAVQGFGKDELSLSATVSALDPYLA
jgi:CheY-like chemotaxis protein